MVILRDIGYTKGITVGVGGNFFPIRLAGRMDNAGFCSPYASAKRVIRFHTHVKLIIINQHLKTFFTAKSAIGAAAQTKGAIIHLRKRLA